MINNIETSLKDMGIILETPSAPLSNYVSVVQSGSNLYLSGQLPSNGGSMVKGCLGKDITLEEAQEAAKYCAINILSQVKAFVSGDWNRVKRCVKLGGFVASSPDFFEHHLVLNGASDFIVKILGEDIGKHARFAVGVAALPLGVVVEIDAIFEIS